MPSQILATTIPAVFSYMARDMPDRHGRPQAFRYGDI